MHLVGTPGVAVMVVLRATKRVLRLLPAGPRDVEGSETALGDWYVNRLVIHRRPLLLLVSSRSLLALLTPARNVRSIPDRLSQLVADRLERLGIPRGLIEAEVAAMRPVVTAPTRDRSVLGILVDFAFVLPHYLRGGAVNEIELAYAEDQLAGTPCYSSRRFDEVVFPEIVTPKLLADRWRSQHS
jgi:hypothetical protein